MTRAELAVQDLIGAEVATRLGFDRIELCSALRLGGLTPPVGLIEAAVEIFSGVHVLIRPRAGGFQYTQAEVELMLREIRFAVAAGAAGVVVGVLDDDGMPDLRVLPRLVEAADGREVTFHRAIDVSRDPRGAARSLLGRGVRRILTSGGAPSADEGRGVLVDLVGICGAEIEVQAGAGINPGNVAAIARTGVAAVHFSASRYIDSAPAGRGGIDFGGHDTVDQGLAEATLAALRR